jgi:CMP-N,N'-diacetyllegionaminic acid synthase
MNPDLPVISLIPARGGSKGLPGKNLKLLGGVPLVGWAIRRSLQAGYDGVTFVSTDCDEISSVAKEFGAKVIRRPPGLSTDRAAVAGAIRHAIAEIKPPYVEFNVLLLEPTCPFRSVEDIHLCVKKLSRLGGEYDSAATFTAASVNPIRTWRIVRGQPRPFVKSKRSWSARQALPVAIQLTGGAYAFKYTSWPQTANSVLFGRAAAVITPFERSIDIDSYWDLLLAQAVLDKGLSG